jgi:catechol 2,3-dioxygenase
MGHVHLHVGDIAKASAFYADALGFDRTTWSYPGALFFGAGGYHHHLGTNVWAGPGARAPEANEARLLEWTIELPTAGDVAAVTDSVARGGYSVRTTDDGDLVTQDPWGTVVRVRAVPSLTT